VRLGILGGGQLARMLALAAAPLGVRARVYDPSPDACAGDVCELATGPYEDHARLREFADDLDAITYEFENVPTNAVDQLAALVPVRPGAQSLRLSQDRAFEKQALTEAGFEVAPWRQVETKGELDDAIAAVGVPAILKTRRGGYDGKGQAIIADREDTAHAWAAIKGRPAILESLVSFQRELSLISVRTSDGSGACYPLVENEHRKGILRVTIAPALGVDTDLQRQAEVMAGRLMSSLGHIGVLTIEFFEVQGRLVANEFAPRVHNSGHWTIDGATTCQFENHVRAVLGMPLGKTKVRSPTIMLNCVGAMPDKSIVLNDPSAKLHDYRKPARPERKVGHVNLVGINPVLAHESAQRLGIDLG